MSGSGLSGDSVLPLGSVTIFTAYGWREQAALQLFDNKPAASATADQRALSLAMKRAN